MKKELYSIVLLMFSSVFLNAQTTNKEKIALDFIHGKANSNERKTREEFKLKNVRKGKSGETLRFQQELKGIPVFGAEYVVNFDNDEKIAFSTNSYDATVEKINVTPTLDTETALKKAKKTLEAKGNLHFEESKLFVYNLTKPTRLAYKINLQYDDKPGDWEIFVDAHTGEIISLKDVAVYHHKKETPNTKKINESKIPYAFRSGRAMVFNPDPLSVGRNTYGVGDYIDNGDNTNESLNNARVNVELPEISFASGNYRLKSSYCDIGDFEQPENGFFEQKSNFFNFTRDQEGFEAVNAFYHIDKNLRYIRNTLGIVCVPRKNNGLVIFDPHGDTSHYLESSEKIALGINEIDGGEDADIILHELGHGVHHWITGGRSSFVEGLGEGCGDYWAQSYSRSLNQWLPTDQEYHFLFNWDGHNEYWEGRTTNYPEKYPQGLKGAIHTDGQIWATALMKIYDIMGRKKTDTAFLEGLALTNSASGQAQAANAFRQAAINMNYPCSDIDTITRIFNDTGYGLRNVPFTLNVPANKKEQTGGGNVFVLPDYRLQCNAIVAGCDAVLTQNPLPNTNVAPGNHIITITAVSPSNGMAAINKTFNLTVESSLSNDQFVKLEFSISPNPANNTITLSGEELINKKMEIFNILGQKIISKEMLSNENSVDISSLNKGVYFVKFQGTNGTKKFIKK
ncbi:T9SS type A sorting domain-containing protein [Flavobacterium covae]